MTSSVRLLIRGPMPLWVRRGISCQGFCSQKAIAGDLCGTSKQPKATAEAALAQWTRAGMPASKLLLGLALYGYVSKSTDKRLSGSSIPQAAGGAHPRYLPKRPKIRGALGDLSNLWGQQIPFSQLVTSGAIRKTGDGYYGGANGYTMGRSFESR